ncbi:MAG: rhodanese-like domain-containing protein [Patescibacteria group bacterium]|nr:rhodanese-like domain-containing protein [Patescibacteria group bacterium]
MKKENSVRHSGKSNKTKRTQNQIKVDSGQAGMTSYKTELHYASNEVRSQKDSSRPSSSNNKLAAVFFLLGFLLLGIGAFVKIHPFFSLISPIPLISLINQNKDSVSPQQLSQMLKKKNFTLINVHIPYEGEIANTDTFIPYDQIMANSNYLPTDRNAPIILYCRSGRMSSEALKTLQKLGYTNVKQLAGGMQAWKKAGFSLLDLSQLENQVLPEKGVELPISWNDLGQKLVSNGVIDLNKFNQAVKPTSEQEKILTSNYSGKIKIDRTNAQFIVDMLWALGLSQKSLVYEQGPMGTTEKKDAANFASTGGWTLAKGNAMNYYNKFDLISPNSLTPLKQKQVAEISKNIYRPCCGNPTWFPDCNHGMAALAIIELLVSQNIPETIIYQKVLGFNSFWFPDQYLTAATYFARQGIAWNKVDAKLLLGPNFSSGQGSQEVAKIVGPLPYVSKNAGSCGT